MNGSAESMAMVHALNKMLPVTALTVRTSKTEGNIDAIAQICREIGTEAFIQVFGIVFWTLPSYRNHRKLAKYHWHRRNTTSSTSLTTALATESENYSLQSSSKMLLSPPETPSVCDLCQPQSVRSGVRPFCLYSGTTILSAASTR